VTNLNIRNYIIGLLAVAVLFFGSVIYKHQNTKACHHFPIPESLKKRSADVPIYLFLFFSKNNCVPCLSDFIEVLNSLPSQFRTAGIVPEDELKNEVELKKVKGVSFPLFSFREYKKYLPGYTPTLFGVSPAGEIVFILPGTQEKMTDLRDIITSIYGKMYLSFESEHSQKSSEK
jgi:hypothetical protein